MTAPFPPGGWTAVDPGDRDPWLKRHPVATKVMGALAGTVMIGGLVVAGVDQFSDKSTDGTELAGDTNDETNEGENSELGCESSTFADVSVDYNSYAFLPAPEKMDNQEDVAPYVKSMFEAAPLGTNLDRASLAFMMATFVGPARETKVEGIDPNYNYQAEFLRKMGEYNGEGGQAKAEADCELAQDTLEQTTEFVERWATKGSTVVRATAIRDTRNNKVVGYNLEEVVLDQDVSGVRFALLPTSRGLDQYPEGAQDRETGIVYLTGIKPEQLGAVIFDNGSAGETPADEGAAGDNPAENGGGGNQDQGVADGENPRGTRGGGGADRGEDAVCSGCQGAGECAQCQGEGTGGGGGDDTTDTTIGEADEPVGNDEPTEPTEEPTEPVDEPDEPTQEPTEPPAEEPEEPEEEEIKGPEPAPEEENPFDPRNP